jgi:hypothetical protein
MLCDSAHSRRAGCQRNVIVIRNNKRRKKKMGRDSGQLHRFGGVGLADRQTSASKNGICEAS